MIAAVHLRLRELDVEAAARIGAVDDFLAKYDPNEPRDWHGRWTTGGAAPSDEDVAGPAPAVRSNTKPESHWDGVSHPTGGHLIHTQNDGRNEPPPDDSQLEPTPSQSINSPEVPPGWDVNNDGRIDREPTLSDGRRWPEATAGVVLMIGAKEGPGKPTMWLLVPRDGKGPTLVGSDDKEEFIDPPGYDKVQLIGIPQETKRDGVPTRHALDSVSQALEAAATNKYSRLYFNSTVRTASNREIDSRLRADLMGVLRPELNSPYRLQPFESYSPRQKPFERELELQGLHPSIARPLGRFYKFLRLLWLQHQWRFGGSALHDGASAISATFHRWYQPLSRSR
jgi:hypothetical protein